VDMGAADRRPDLAAAVDARVMAGRMRACVGSGAVVWGDVEVQLHASGAPDQVPTDEITCVVCVSTRLWYSCGPEQRWFFASGGAPLFPVGMVLGRARRLATSGGSASGRPLMGLVHQVGVRLPVVFVRCG
jgi:hypothetical protein